MSKKTPSHSSVCQENIKLFSLSHPQSDEGRRKEKEEEEASFSATKINLTQEFDLK
jgi:hypothetical protein